MDLLSSFKSILSLNQSELYWKDIDFDRGKAQLSQTESRIRIQRVKLLKNILFEHLNKSEKEVYIIPWYYNELDFSWFLYYKGIRQDFYYKEIIKAANSYGLMLKQNRIISYGKYEILAEKLFLGNVNYLTEACFMVPEDNIVYFPTHSVELIIRGNRNDIQYINTVRELLEKSDKFLLYENF